MNDSQVTLTKGQKVMSVQFNPGQREDVAKIKQDCANLYDFLDSEFQKKQKAADDVYQSWLKEEEAKLQPLEQTVPIPVSIPEHIQKMFEAVDEAYRLRNEAFSHLETFQMYAVKSVTR